MPSQTFRGPIIVLLVSAVTLTAACSNFKLPRMTEEQFPKPLISGSVNLIFEEPLQDSKLTFNQLVCSNTTWEGRLGETIVETFTKAARSRVAQVTVGPQAQAVTPAAGSAAPVTASLAIEHASFNARTRMGSEDVFLAHLELHLRATATDPTSQQTAVAPLVFSDDVKLWVPQYGGNACTTMQFDERMNTAVDNLASQWLNFIMAALSRPSQSPTQVAKASPTVQTGPAGVSATGQSPIAPATLNRAGGKDPDRFAVIVGLNLYRSPWPGWKEGLTFDSKESLSTFAERFDVPEAQTLLLQDELAAQSDIEEALTQWLPKRVTKDSVVLFYFAGRTTANQKDGEVFLIPYDATPASSPYRLISLRYLQSRLQKLGARLTLAMIDGPLATANLPADRKAKVIPPNWIADLNSPTGPKGGSVIQLSKGQPSSTDQGTLLASSGHSADLDHDGIVTVGEWLRSLRGHAVTAPSLPPSLAVQSIPLAHLNHK